LPVALPPIKIGYCGAQRGAGSVRVEGLAGHPKASLIVLDTGLEVRDETGSSSPDTKKCARWLPH
jgi:hypothetical protein